MPAVLQKTTQNPAAGRSSCIDRDGKKEEGSSPLTSTIPRSPDFLLFGGHGRRWQGASQDMGGAASTAWCWRNALRFLGFSLSVA